MTEHAHTSTPLWRNTLAARPGLDPHAGERERLRTSYTELRRKAGVLLEENARSMPDFTVHDISHVDALWETADLVCGDEVTLNPAEAYVLGCAFVLHDAAMGAAAYGTTVPEALGERRWHDLVSLAHYEREGCWPDREELDAPSAEIAEACVATAIRETHAEQAKRLVDQPWRTSAGNEIFLIEEVQLREWYGPLIGELAASHWWPVDRLAGEFRHPIGSLPWQPSEWIIEPLRLACILRLADATQVDSRASAQLPVLPATAPWCLPRALAVPGTHQPPLPEGRPGHVQLTASLPSAGRHRLVAGTGVSARYRPRAEGRRRPSARPRQGQARGARRRWCRLPGTLRGTVPRAGLAAHRRLRQGLRHPRAGRHARRAAAVRGRARGRPAGADPERPGRRAGPADAAARLPARAGGDPSDPDRRGLVPGGA
ncbi:hypothetical protein R2F25_18460 [Streptomyces sp. UP1A-1]|nr:hypothetical protein [Streptomyces sp. UP1A-1]